MRTSSPEPQPQAGATIVRGPAHPVGGLCGRATPRVLSEHADRPTPRSPNAARTPDTPSPRAPARAHSSWLALGGPDARLRQQPLRGPTPSGARQGAATSDEPTLLPAPTHCPDMRAHNAQRSRATWRGEREPKRISSLGRSQVVHRGGGSPEARCPEPWSHLRNRRTTLGVGRNSMLRARFVMREWGFPGPSQVGVVTK